MAEMKPTISGHLIMKAAFIINKAEVDPEEVAVTFDSDEEEIVVAEKPDFDGTDKIRRAWMHSY